MLRTRRITKPAFPIPGVKVCDECERPKKIKRNHAGRSYCDACYKRGFEHMPCAACGETCVAKRGTVVPYCRRCETAQRLCKGCGRHVPRAGMIHEGEVVCPSCVPNYKTEEPCPACGEPSSRLSRVGGEGEAICDRCRNEQDHVTCGTCGRYRRQADTTAPKPICVECVDGITHTCPDCQKDVPGGGKSRCRDCAARARGRAQVETCCETLHQTWVQDLFRRHCEADLLAAPRGDVVRRIEKAAAFFVTMDSTMARPAAVTSDSLLAAYGPEGLRRASKAVLFIVDALRISWSTRATEDFAERNRIRTMLGTITDRPWGGDVAAYAAALQSDNRDRPLREQTVRMYLRAAIDFMQGSGKDTVAELDASDVTRFVRNAKGHASSLAAFCSWASLHHGIDISVVAQKREIACTAEKRMLTITKMIVDRAGRAEKRAEAMALLASSLSRLYGVPLASILELRWSDVSQGPGTVLRFGVTEVNVEDGLAAILFRWNTVTENEIVFSSDRKQGHPMSTSAIAYHVRRITSR